MEAAPPPLILNKSELLTQIVHSQGSGEVLSVDVLLRGRPGLVRMHVCDAAGTGGGSALTPDTLELKLAAGPMAGLAFEGPPSLACGMRAVLPSLRVIAADDFGNRTTSPAFEASSSQGHIYEELRADRAKELQSCLLQKT